MWWRGPTQKCFSGERSSHLNFESVKKGSVYPTGHLCVVLHFLIFLPVFGKESTDPVGQNASLVINILQNILGPHHEIPDLVAW